MPLSFELWGSALRLPDAQPRSVQGIAGDLAVYAATHRWTTDVNGVLTTAEDVLEKYLDPFGAILPSAFVAGRQLGVNTGIPDVQAPRTLALDDGNVLFTWELESFQTRHQVILDSGIRTPLANTGSGSFRLDLTPATQAAFARGTYAVDELSNGELVVAAALDDSGAGTDPPFAIRVVAYQRPGSEAFAPVTASTTVLGDQLDPAVAAFAAGGFAVAWTDLSQRADDASGAAVRARVFANDGTPASAELLVNTSTDGAQQNADVAALSGGGFVVAWQEQGSAGADPGNWGIRAQRFDAAGAKLGAQVDVNTISGGEQTQPAVLALADGGWLVAWIYNDAWVEAQAFAADGSFAGAEFRVGVTAMAGSVVDLATMSDGRVLATWDSVYGGLDGQFLDARPGLLYGGAQADVILGHDAGQSNPRDVLVADGGNDTLYGLAGDDYLYGWTGNDILVAGTGSDVLLGQADNDTLYGEDGDDYLYGGAGTNVFVGGAGVDVLISEGTGDVLYGGDGGDYFYGYGGGTTVALGEAGNDIFVLQQGPGIAHGGDGQDYFYMGSGADQMFGGAGVDVLIGQSTGGATGAGDLFDGGADTDYLWLTPGADRVVIGLQSGVDVLNGFDPARDVLELRGTGLASFAQVRSAAVDYSSLCIIGIDANTAIWLVGVSASQLQEAGFVFS